MSVVLEITTMQEKIQEILPRLAELAPQAEHERKAPAQSIALLKNTGLHRAFQPKAYGGLELSLPEFAECLVALAGADAGTTWAFSLLCTHSHQLAMFSKQLQDELWLDDPDATASSSIAPFGRTEEVDGGILFSGEMGWSSGCDYANWAIVGFNRIGAKNEKHYSFAVIPRNDYEIRDDWYAIGMRGSGSKTLIFDRVFVPEHRIQAAQDMMTGKSAGYGLYPESKIYYTPYRPYFACGFSAISLGVAERMIQAFKEKTKNRVRAYTGANVGTATPALMRLAQSTHQVAAARAFLEKTWEDHRAHGEQQLYPSVDTLTQWRTNQAYAVKMCVTAVDRLFSAAGASAWFETNEIQRLFRDSHMTAAHAYTDYDVCAQIYGRQLMDLEPDPTMI